MYNFKLFIKDDKILVENRTGNKVVWEHKLSKSHFKDCIAI